MEARHCAGIPVLGRVAELGIGTARDRVDDRSIHASADTFDSSCERLMAESVGQRLDGLARLDHESVEVQQDVELPERELALSAEDPQARSS
jgi:hypothetical protein